jgi:hypothetical protein
MKVLILKPEYVEQFPEEMKEGVLYICEEFDLTAHKCCCGCGEDVYNKLGPAKWRLTKMPDGSVSLDPSIGNWKYACRSHYWISKNRVIDAGAMSARAIEAVQQKDRRDRDKHVAQFNAQSALKEKVTAWGHIRSIYARTLNYLRALWPW